MDGQSIVLDVFCQQPNMTKLYTQICHCYRLEDMVPYSIFIETLTRGLERLTASFPWVAAQVINEGATEGNSGVFKLAPFENLPRLVIKELRDDNSVPTIGAMEDAGFPFRMLDENLIAPINTIPTEDTAADPAPVFAIQATYIIGGLLLTFVSQHNVMDFTGQGQIMGLFSKACHGQAFTEEELLDGPYPRRNLISLLDTETATLEKELAHQIVKPDSERPPSTSTDGIPAPPPPSNCTWKYVTFSPPSLATLKAKTTKSLPDSSKFISTDDALSAFIWQSVMRARHPRMDPAKKVTFARAIDPRRYVGVSETYAGLIQNMTYHSYTLKEVLQQPLGVIAANLREAVDPKTTRLGYNTRALATYIDRALDKNVTDVTADLDLSSDLMLSSWTKVNGYAMDFNLGLGPPVAVRRPQFVAVESLSYLMPRALDGEIALAICLRDEDMERLRTDEEFIKYGRYIP
ncbi:hypothetical protein MMC25_006499 [Agyrium rufum]|nr:hypothetical protein [Agyrium rufum]